MTLQSADSSYNRIETVIRRLTALSSQSSLPSSEIQTLVNNFITQYLPFSIKVDQMRNVYTFFTQPNVDTYPLDVDFNQGVRAPVYIDGIQGSFYKDRQQFFAVWPKFHSPFNNLINGDGITATFSFTIPGPFFPNTVTIGGTSSSGQAVTCGDDGLGNIQLLTPNPRVSNPLQTSNPAFAGMYNQNLSANSETSSFLGGPGVNNPVNIGTVNYVTGAFNITFPSNAIPAAGTTYNIFVSQYTTGRPISVLFWNNTFTIRPCPKLVHRIEVETYLSPVQMMQTTDVPILDEWALYISYGVAMEILRQRQDLDGVQNLSEGFHLQENLVLARQGTEELFTPTPTVFNSVSTYSTGPWGNSGSTSW